MLQALIITLLLLIAGIISDVQYADIPNGTSFSGIPRYYRASLTCLQTAVSAWRAAEVDFCIHMGDIVDGFNPPDAAEAALDRVVAEFDQLGKPHYHMIGNHCLYHLSRPVSNFEHSFLLASNSEETPHTHLAI